MNFNVKYVGEGIVPYNAKPKIGKTAIFACAFNKIRASAFHFQILKMNNYDGPCEIPAPKAGHNECTWFGSGLFGAHWIRPGPISLLDPLNNDVLYSAEKGEDLNIETKAPDSFVIFMENLEAGREGRRIARLFLPYRHSAKLDLRIYVTKPAIIKTAVV